jgi:hypothetical protein
MCSLGTAWINKPDTDGFGSSARSHSKTGL